MIVDDIYWLCLYIYFSKLNQIAQKTGLYDGGGGGAGDTENQGYCQCDSESAN